MSVICICAYFSARPWTPQNLLLRMNLMIIYTLWIQLFLGNMLIVINHIYIYIYASLHTKKHIFMSIHLYLQLGFPRWNMTCYEYLFELRNSTCASIFIYVNICVYTFESYKKYSLENRLKFWIYIHTITYCIGTKMYIYGHSCSWKLTNFLWINQHK